MRFHTQREGRERKGRKEDGDGKGRDGEGEKKRQRKETEAQTSPSECCLVTNNAMPCLSSVYPQASSGQHLRNPARTSCLQLPEA